MLPFSKFKHVVIMEQKTITYEQPLNEHIRVALRLEYLFKKAEHYLEKESTWDLHNAVVAIIDILNAIDRPDLKSKLTYALRSHAMALVHLAEIPGVDQDKLRKIMDKLGQFIDLLTSTQGKLGQELRDNEFLTTVRQRLAIAGGTTDFAIPAYHLWLQQPTEVKQKNVQGWFCHFKQLQDIIKLLLQLTRDSAKPKTKIADKGFYQEALAAEIAYQMFRVELPLELNMFPEISVGRYRLSIHFFHLNIEGRAQQVTDDVEFALTCCRI